MSDKLDMIYDLLKNDREDASDFRKEVRESHKTTGKRLGTLEVQGEIQNQQLTVHIAGVDTLKKLHEDNVNRIELVEDDVVKLKKPSEVRSAVKKWILGLGSISAAIIVIAKVIGLF